MYKAIIIDDISLVRDAIKMLGNWDIFEINEIYEAANAETGLQIILEKKPDIIITDMKMPVMDGTALLRKLEELKIPGKIIIISGFSDYAYTRLAIKSGAIDYILKPIDAQDLNNALAEAVSQLEKDSTENNYPCKDESGTVIPPTTSSKLVNDAIEFINKNYLSDISLNDVAQKFFVSKEHLSRLFKKRNGIQSFFVYNAVKTGRSKAAFEDK